MSPSPPGKDHKTVPVAAATAITESLTGLAATSTPQSSLSVVLSRKPGRGTGGDSGRPVNGENPYNDDRPPARALGAVTKTPPGTMTGWLAAPPRLALHAERYGAVVASAGLLSSWFALPPTPVHSVPKMGIAASVTCNWGAGPGGAG